MQTNALPIQPNLTANPAAAGNAGRNSLANGDQFGALLSNEMAQRQAPAPKAPEAPRPQAPKPAGKETARPAERAPAQAAQAGNANAAKESKETAKAGDGDRADDKAGDQAEGAADPAAAMLALMASLQPQAQDAGKKDADAGVAAAFDALTGAGGKRSDAAQLAALQAAMKNAGMDEGAADGAFAKTFAAIGKPTNPALAAAGAALAGEDRAVSPDAGGADAANAANSANAAGAADGRLQAVPAGMEEGAQALPHEAELAQAALRAARDAEPAGAAALQAAQLQPAALEAAQAAAGAPDQLRARVGTNAWENQVGQKVVWMVGSEEQTASLTLNPPDLGPMQVVLSVTNDQASVTFSSSHEEVRQALENALPRLREMMSENGIALGNATVDAGMPDGRQAQQDQPARAPRWNGSNRGRDGAIASGEATVAPARTRAVGGSGVVDTFA